TQVEFGRNQVGEVRVVGEPDLEVRAALFQGREGGGGATKLQVDPRGDQSQHSIRVVPIEGSVVLSVDPVRPGEHHRPDREGLIGAGAANGGGQDALDLHWGNH